MAAERQILAAAGGRLECPLVLSFFKATGAVRLFRLDAEMGAVLLLRLDAAIGAVSPLFADAVTAAILLLPSVPGGGAGANANEPLADIAPLLPHAAARRRRVHAPPLRLAVDVPTGAVPPTGLAAAPDPEPPLSLAVAADAAPFLGLAVAADAAHQLRQKQPVRGPNAVEHLSQRRTATDIDAIVALFVEAVNQTRSRAPTPISSATQKSTGAKRSKTKRVRKTVQIAKKKASEGSSKKLARFRGILGDFVWFAVPSVLVFYPKTIEAEIQSSKLQVSLKWIEPFSRKDLEKKIIMTVFVIFLSVWILGYLLSSLGRGLKCSRVVGNLTLATVVSVTALVDYSMYKSTAPSYMVLFAAHFIVMTSLITYMWKKYVYGTNQEPGLLSAIKGWRGWKFHRSQSTGSVPRAGLPESANELSEPLLGPEMV